MDFQAKPATHRRMVKLPLKARADILQPRQYDPSTVVMQTVVQSAAAASSTSVPVVSGLPSSTAALAAVAGVLALIFISVAGCCFYRRRKIRSHTKKAPSASFNHDAFAEKKNPFTTGLDPPIVKVDLPINTRVRPPPLPLTPSSASSTEETGKSDSSGTFRVTNNPDRQTAMPALPKAVAEKRRPSQRVKSSWMSPNAEEFIGSPPPSYDMANGNGSPNFLIPIPPQLPPQKARVAAAPQTPPATKVSHSKPSKKGSNLQALIVPQYNTEPAPVPSPARSESFARKDLVIPTPALVLSSAPSSMPSNSNNEISPKSGSGARMMTVVAPYTPTLADELNVIVGDTVRLLQEYQDGWGFVQFVGKGDAPKGVVPLVCLQERKRVVPAMPHKTSNGSVSSFTTNWR
ncbi:hypothetical protein BDN70DRAFT_872151 [Pholiota conissans]|uniref:SH3 domain-containing protein n=1 Tax=Pholiota conissans TaxID=109636 RepID=A0A9P5ZAU4_9AGAR|nr:hypothetical protein BDN70DRAFT_872151 [Pholiota conissans]